jgi:Protein kinase domain
MCHQVQIKLSEKHKRVFYVKSKEMAAEIVKRMRVAAGAREVEEYYGPQNSSINAAGMTGKEGSSGVNNPQANILGQGTYGKVYKAFQKTTQKPVAIKQINKKALILEELELQQHEIHLYRTLTDDNYRGTVRLLDVFEDHL